MSQKLQNKWDMKKHRQYKGVMVQCLMSQKLGVILPPAAAPQLLAGEKHNSQWSGQIDLSPLQGFHGQAVGKPLQRGKRLRSPSRASFICSGSLDFTGFPLFLCLHEVVDSWFYNAFSNKFCISSVASLVTKAAEEHPKINLLLAAKAAYGCQGTRYGAVLSKASWNKSKLLEKN